MIGAATVRSAISTSSTTIGVSSISSGSNHFGKPK
jgi:hypothetical protein